MRPRLLVVVAGVPRDISERVSDRLKRANKNIEVVSLAMPEAGSYSTKYVIELYGRVANKLREMVDSDRRSVWKVNLVVLFVRTGDGDEHELVEHFGLEALLVPVVMDMEERRAPRKHRNQEIANALQKQANRALKGAREILGFLAEEVGNRENKTSVLLPAKNFGGKFERVRECVQGAIASGTYGDRLEKRLRSVEARLPKEEGQWFRGKGLVFEAPSRAGPRHGLSPAWDDRKHGEKCVIRGHVRFGVGYNPGFHYDCSLEGSGKRELENCHGRKKVKPGHSHANIAPNDNVRLGG